MTVATGVPLGSWPRSITSATTPTRPNSLLRRGSRKTRSSSPGSIGSVAVTAGKMIASSRGISSRFIGPISVATPDRIADVISPARSRGSSAHKPTYRAAADCLGDLVADLERAARRRGSGGIVALLTQTLTGEVLLHQQ